jgi:hypothetical protein
MYIAAAAPSQPASQRLKTTLPSRRCLLVVAESVLPARCKLLRSLQTSYWEYKSNHQQTSKVSFVFQKVNENDNEK